MEENAYPWMTYVKAGNMCLNRFCIDEDAAFELSGVNYLKKSDYDIIAWSAAPVSEIKVQVKGKKD